MNTHLRFGMHRDAEVIRDICDKIDGLVIPAHILAYQSPPTSVFVASMPKPYFIDPMTFIFQNPKVNNLNEAGNLRMSIRRLCQAYGNNLENIIEHKSNSQTMQPTDIADIGKFCKEVCEYQCKSIEEKSSSSKAAKYIERYGKLHTNLPRLIIPPYFRFNSVADVWYAFNIACAFESAKLIKDIPLGIIIHCSVNILNASTIKKIASDYSNYKNTIIWLDDFNELAADVTQIINARKFIRILSKQSKVETLYGGYLLIESNRDGLDALSHGILYGQHKSFNLTPGAGGMAERYYIPKFHSFRSLSQTDIILHKHRELMCNCEICNEVMNGDPDNIILFADEPEKLRQHFMTVRKMEVERIGTVSLSDEIADLRRVYNTYHNSISKLPNPDAFVSGHTMNGLNYLQTWADGIEQKLD
jgi:hypothetical protein